MPTQPPLPPILIPYVSPPPRSSLTLVTSVIGATSNWLVLRFLLATLSSGSSRAETAPLDGNGDDGVKGGRRKVVLLSFLRNWEFWKSEAKRLGLDLARLSEQGRFAFIDGLSELFYSSSSSTSPSPSLSQSGSSVPPPSLGRTTTLPVRSPPGTVPARVPGTTTPATAGSSSSLNRASTASESTIKRLRFTGRGTAALDALEKDVLAVVEELQTKGRTAASPDGGSGGDDDENGVVLVIDQPDLLLAATGPSQGIGATEMGEWIMGLEQRVHSTILTLSADSPLIHNAAVSTTSVEGTVTPLETEHAAFVIGLAHRAWMVMQLRNLDTGAAKDVSGVLRVSKGGGASDDEGLDWEEKEVLYFVQRDAGVRVFGRGE